jgi:tetratricopeptide (TPR) repeat protein
VTSVAGSDGDVDAAVALLGQAFRLVDEGRLPEALAAYGGIVDRWGWPLGPGLRSELARAAGEAGASAGGPGEAVVDRPAELDEGALWHRGEMSRVLTRTLMSMSLAFQRLDRGDAALEVWKVVAGHFGEASDLWILVRVASAMSCIGQEMWTQERHEEALEAWEALVARFGQVSDPQIVGYVAEAMLRIGYAFWSLERREDAVAAYEALIDRFGDATVPDVRLSVSWALWNESGVLGQLGRTGERIAVRERLAARHDEVLSPEISAPIANCLLGAGSRIRDAGEPERSLSVYDELLARFGDATEEDVRLQVARALRAKGYALWLLGRLEEEVATYDEMVRRFGDIDRSSQITPVLADGLARKASTLETLGRLSEAIDAFDGALVLLHGSEDPKQLKQQLSNVVDKGGLLWRASRGPEAAVVFQGAVAAYGALAAVQSEFDVEALGRVVFAMVCRVLLLPDPTAANESADQLAELLADVAVPGEAPRPRAIQVPEGQIAARLAEFWNGASWIEFATAGDDDATLDSMANRALEIYHETAGWLTGHLAAEVSDADGPAIAAAWIVRTFADGYALLARRWDQTSRSGLSLPSQLLAELGIRETGIEEWSEAQGHPLELPDSADLAEELVEDNRRETEDLDWESQIAPDFLRYIHLYEMLLVLCDSANGRAALQDRSLKDWACRRLNDSRITAGWVHQHLDDADGVTVARLLIAEAYFVATHGAAGSAHGLFPSREELREVLIETEAYEWLETQDIELPRWLDPPTP